MKRVQAYKFKIDPDGDQQRKLRQFAGMVRFVFNKALALQQENRDAGGKYIQYVPMAKLLTDWRNGQETPWLKDAPVHPLQHALKHLDRAYKNFFEKRASFPVFKKRGRNDSFRFPDGKQIKLDQVDERICLPKLGWINYRKSQKVKGLIKNCTVSFKAGHWYVSIQTERTVAQVRHPAATAVGIDAGVVRFSTLWDGQAEQVIEPINSFKKHEDRLVKAQRQMSRKVKFSSNWKRAKLRVQKIQHQIANVRNDFLHKTSHSISKNHALLCVEDLRIGNMSRSASGTLEDPGKNVAAKSGLNKAILDQGWGEFGRQLDYKSAWKGGWLVAVPPANTSRECPVCRHISADNRKSQSVFLCVACGHTENADLVAAKNIRERGLTSSKARTLCRIVCEVNGAVRPSAAGTRRSEQVADAT